MFRSFLIWINSTYLVKTIRLKKPEWDGLWKEDDLLDTIAMFIIFWSPILKDIRLFYYNKYCSKHVSSLKSTRVYITMSLYVTKVVSLIVGFIEKKKKEIESEGIWIFIEKYIQYDIRRNPIKGLLMIASLLFWIWVALNLIVFVGLYTSIFIVDFALWVCYDELAMEAIVMLAWMIFFYFIWTF